MGATFSRSATLAVCRNNELLAVVVFFDYTKFDCEMAVASIDPRWLNKTILRAIFRYAFEQLGCHRVTGRVKADNLHAIQFDEKLGFVREGTLRQAVDGVDVHIYGMLKTECRWI